MKTKNLLFGVLAAVIAIGSAFASTSSLVVVGYAKVNHATQGDPYCLTVRTDCAGSGSFACQADITIFDGSTVNSVQLRPTDCPVNTTVQHSSSVATTFGDSNILSIYPLNQ